MIDSTQYRHLWGTEEARAIFDAYASTIDLRPEEAASPAP